MPHRHDRTPLPARCHRRWDSLINPDAVGDDVEATDQLVDSR